MKYEMPLIEATLLKRYKRFLADVELGDGRIETVHCPNTGSMKNCVVPGSRCWLLRSQNPKRKYPLTWELATTADGALAGINTGRANALVVEAIENGTIPELQGYSQLKTEQKYGSENSRIDILLESEEQRCYVEVKSVTLAEDHRQGFFPDSVSDRGSKHLRELMQMIELGHRAVLVFCVQHNAIKQVAPAAHIDVVYAETLSAAMAKGVEVIAYQVGITTDEIKLVNALPVVELNNHPRAVQAKLDGS